MSDSAAKPIAPCACTPKRPAINAASEARALAAAIAAAVAGSPGAVSNRVSAAAQAAMASACWMRTSAAPCCRLWKLPIGWPNCTRTLR